jgi:hypothetical protein
MDHRNRPLAFVKPKEDAMKAAQAADFLEGTQTLLE